ncbi:MAG: MBOAT family O-acyltransferase, partial [Pseudomonadota bacterium]
MFVDPQLHLYITLATVLFFYLIPKDYPRQRLILLLFVSGLLIFYAAPYALFACLLLGGATLILGRFLASGKSSTVVYIGALSVPILTIVGFEYAETNAPIIAKLGVSYFSLKAATVLVDCRRGQASPKLGEIFFLLMFYPIYSAGPIERAKTLGQGTLQSAFSVDNVGQGLLRIAMGIFLSVYVANALLHPLIDASYPSIVDNPDRFSALDVYLYLMLSFLALYIAFTGYTDIAIGTARLLGIKVQENFHFPLMATSIQNFWQRWHLSLSSIISIYLFKPMVRATGRPMLAIFSAFTVIGLW